MQALDPRLKKLVRDEVDQRLSECGIIEDEFLSFSEAHKYLKMDRNAFHRYVMDDKVEYVQVGKNHRGPVRVFAKTTLDEFKAALA